MASSTEEFAARARSIFGALGDAASSVWKLDTQQGFKPGAEDGQDSSDEEEGPQPLEGAAGSDEEGIEEANQYRLKASCAYIRAFEQEEEEDEFDRQAAGSGDEGSRPLRSMEVLEDNAFDRRHSQQYSQQHRGIMHTQEQGEQQQQQASISAPSPAGAGGNAAADTAPAAMDVDEGLPALEPTAAAPAPTTHTQQGPAQQDAGQLAKQQQQQHPAKRHRTGFGQFWVPPHRRPDFKPAEETAQAKQHNNRQQQQQQRSVRFADGGPAQQQQGRGWGRNDAGRGRGRRSNVPDHVKHPHKYTVYTLDEPLYIGQGGGDDRENEKAAAAAAAVHGGQAAGRSSGSSRGRAATGVAGSGLQQESAADWMHDAAPMLLDGPETVRPSVHTATSKGDLDSESTAAVQPPTAGTIKFQPSSKHSCGDGLARQSASKTAAAAKAVSANVVKHLGAFADDDEPSAAAVAPAAVHNSRKTSRQYRAKHADNEDA